MLIRPNTVQSPKGFSFIVMPQHVTFESNKTTREQSMNYQIVEALYVNI